MDQYEMFILKKKKKTLLKSNNFSNMGEPINFQTLDALSTGNNFDNNDPVIYQTSNSLSAGATASMVAPHFQVCAHTWSELEIDKNECLNAVTHQPYVPDDRIMINGDYKQYIGGGADGKTATGAWLVGDDPKAAFIEKVRDEMLKRDGDWDINNENMATVLKKNIFSQMFGQDASTFSNTKITSHMADKFYKSDNVPNLVFTDTQLGEIYTILEQAGTLKRMKKGTNSELVYLDEGETFETTGTDVYELVDGWNTGDFIGVKVVFTSQSSTNHQTAQLCLRQNAVEKLTITFDQVHDEVSPNPDSDNGGPNVIFSLLKNTHEIGHTDVFEQKEAMVLVPEHFSDTDITIDFGGASAINSDQSVHTEHTVKYTHTKYGTTELKLTRKVPSALGLTVTSHTLAGPLDEDTLSAQIASLVDYESGATKSHTTDIYTSLTPITLSSITEDEGKDLYSTITESTNYKLRITSIHGDSVILPFTRTVA
jgi:hypothetical protein